MSRTSCTVSSRASSCHPLKTYRRTKQSTRKSGRKPSALLQSSPLLMSRLYHHSNQTFLSMTSQRALHSASRFALYPSTQPNPLPVPSSPTTKGHTRDASVGSSIFKAEEGPINFRTISEEERAKLWRGLKKSLGVEKSQS